MPGEICCFRCVPLPSAIDVVCRLVYRFCICQDQACGSDDRARSCDRCPTQQALYLCTDRMMRTEGIATHSVDCRNVL